MKPIDLPEAAGLLQVSVVNGTEHLFDMEFPASSYIQFRLYEAEQAHQYGRKWTSTRGPRLAEFAMSRTQLMSAILDTNSGVGTPCTLRQVGDRSYPRIEPEDAPNSRALLAEEAKEAIIARTTELVNTVKMIKEMKLPKGKTAEIVRELEGTIRKFTGDFEFLAKSFDETLSAAEQVAKAELSAYLGQHAIAQELGLIETPTQLLLEGNDDSHLNSHDSASQPD